VVDSSNKSTSPLIERLQLRKTEAELRAENAAGEAQLAKLDLNTSNAPENKVTIEGDPPTESMILAYRTLTKVGDRIANEFKRIKHEYSRIVLLNSDFCRVLRELSMAKRNLAVLTEHFNSAVNNFEDRLELAQRETALSTMAVAGAAINSALELAVLFRVERSFKYSKFDSDNEALVSAVAGALLKKGIDFYDPSKILACNAAEEVKNRISSGLIALQRHRMQLLALKHRIDAEKSASPQADEARLKILEATFLEVAATVEEIEAAIALFVKPDETTGLTAFARLLEAEQLAGALEKTALLSLKLVSLMGATRSKRGLFSTSLAFSGGCVVSFALSDISGKVLAAEVIPAYSGYVDADQLPQTDGLKELIAAVD